MDIDINILLKEANDFAENYNFDGAISRYKYLVNLAEDKHRLYLNIGITYRKLHEFKSSIKYLKKAIEFKPGYTSAYYALFETYAYMGNYEKAFRYQEWSFADDTLRHPDLEVSKNKRLDWEDRFVQEALYNRFNIKGVETIDTTYEDILSKIEGKILSIVSSQGLGDVIQCSRYINELLKYKPKKIIFVVSLELLRLFDQLKSDVIEVTHLTPINYDYFIPIFSLMKLLRVDNQPKPKWLSTLDRDNDYAKIKINDMSNKVKIGIVWKGNPKHSNDRKRSMSLIELIEEINSNGDNTIFSFQLDATEEEKQIMNEHNIIDISHLIHDVYDMAVYMRQMNMFISIDSAPVHLAGSLGIKTFCLLPQNYEDWRWGYTGEYKWYDNLKILRRIKK